MNETIRRIAVSGSAAVALLGGAATLATVTAEPASAADMQTAINHATGAPVTLPDGRTMHVLGLDNASYRADTSHHAAAITLASVKTISGGTDSITNGLTPDTGGSGTALQNPYNTGQVPAGYGQQIQTQAGGATIGVGIVAILVLGITVFVKVKHSGLKVGDAVIVTLFGIALSGTVIGAMGSDLTNSVVGSVGGMLGGLG